MQKIWALVLFAVLIAEVVNHYCPRIIEVHNYTAANAMDKKITNWKLLNRY